MQPDTIAALQHLSVLLEAIPVDTPGGEILRMFGVTKQTSVTCPRHCRTWLCWQNHT